VVVTAEVLEARNSEVEGFVRALIRASRDFNANPQSWAEIMLEMRPDQTPENLTLLADAFVGAWSVNGGLNADELRFSVGRIFEGEDFAGLVPPEFDQWVDFTVIDGILGEIGIDETADLPLR
jgi:NitT/TauT family transport system substrate-binding protein